MRYLGPSQHPLVWAQLARRLLGGKQCLGVRDSRGMKLQTRAADLKLLVMFQVAFLDRFAFDLRSGRAPQVDQVKFRPLPQYLAVQPRDTEVGQSSVRLLSPPDGYLHALGEVDGSAGIRPADNSQIGLHGEILFWLHRTRHKARGDRLPRTLSLRARRHHSSSRNDRFPRCDVFASALDAATFRSSSS